MPDPPLPRPLPGGIVRNGTPIAWQKISDLLEHHPTTLPPATPKASGSLDEMGVALLVLGSGMLAFLVVFFLVHLACIYCCCVADTPCKHWQDKGGGLGGTGKPRLRGEDGGSSSCEMGRVRKKGKKGAGRPAQQLARSEKSLGAARSKSVVVAVKPVRGQGLTGQLSVARTESVVSDRTGMSTVSVETEQ